MRSMGWAWPCPFSGDLHDLPPHKLLRVVQKLLFSYSPDGGGAGVALTIPLPGHA